MAQKELTENQKTLGGLVFSGMGIMIVLMALDIIPMDEADKNAPDWVIIACGLVFFLAGVMIKVGDRGRWSDLLAGFLVLCFGLVGGWVSLFGSGENMSGGLAFLPWEANVSLARIVFGFGSLICLSISVYAFTRFFRGREKV